MGKEEKQRNTINVGRESFRWNGGKSVRYGNEGQAAILEGRTSWGKTRGSSPEDIYFLSTESWLMEKINMEQIRMQHNKWNSRMRREGGNADSRAEGENRWRRTNKGCG